MTREEAAKTIDYLKEDYKQLLTEEDTEALGMAIEALKKDETTLHVSGVNPDRIVRPIDLTIKVDLESGVVPRSACEPRGPKTIIYADR